MLRSKYAAIARLTLVALVALPMAALARTAFDASRADLSVVRIVAETRGRGGTGTGFVLNADGHVATNHHVIEDAESVSVIFSGSRNLVPAGVVWQSAGLDLAILQVRRSGIRYHPVTIAKKAQLEQDMQLYAMGYPAAADALVRATSASLAKGIVSRLYRGAWGGGAPLSIIQHEVNINPGNSGGPLFDACGRVVGVNTAGASEAQGILLSSHISELARELDRQSINYTGDDAPCEAASAEEAEALAKGAASTADEAKASAEKTAAAIVRWGIVLSVLSALAILLALRKPRERIIQVVGDYSRKLSHRSPAQPRNPAPQAHNRPPPAARRKISRGLLLTGFSAAGHPLRVAIEANALNAARVGVSVGRGEGLVDVVAHDAEVSRRHVRFCVVDGAVAVEDLNSSNGTRLNGKMLQPFRPAAVRPGDIVSLGAIEFNVS